MFWGRLKRKIVKEPLPPENIAGGWALGIFVGCAIPFGMQLVIAIPLALMLRVSRLGATVGTFITNPATIFVIYPAQTFIVTKCGNNGYLPTTISENSVGYSGGINVGKVGHEGGFRFCDLAVGCIKEMFASDQAR